MIKTFCRNLFAIVLAGAASYAYGSVDPSVDPKGWLQAFDKATVADRGWTVDNLRIELGRAHLEIEKGTLVPVRGPATRAQEFLFVGKARFILATEDPVESYQLELFTQRSPLEEPVTRAVLAIAADDVVDGLSARAGSAPLSAEEARDAGELLKAWRASREYRRSGIRLLALADAVPDPTAQRFAAAWIDTPRLGRFLLRVDPYVRESLAVEQFVPLRLGDLDKEAWTKWLRAEQFDGRRLNVDPEDFGTWDIWYQEALGGHSTFESEHYELEMQIDADIASVTGHTQVDTVSRTDGARVIGIVLFSDLEVDAITLRGGAALPWARSANVITAVLPAPAAAGAKIAVDVRYHGVLFERNEDKLIVKRTTTDWYPRIGTIDRATYRAIFDTPGSWVLLGSGRKSEDAKTGSVRRQVRQLDKPSAFFGFEIGKFKVVERGLGHVALTIGFLTDLHTASESERETTIATIAAALATYEERFGPYPLDELTVATTRHEFAQGFLGFVTLADDLVQGVDGDGAGPLDQRRIIAHELAHQWWGNVVGWTSDRDVWLSESLANYSAALFRRKTTQGTQLAGASAYLDLIEGEDFKSETIVGRPIEAIGPLTIGSRLDSSLSDEAYHAIVYQKGAKVLAMLAEQLGEEQFLAMLKEIAQRANFRPLDTETVLGALAKMSGRNLDAFARSFVHGVGYPELHYAYAVDPGEGGFVLRGSVNQVPRGFRRDRLVHSENGAFDVASTYVEYQSAQDAVAGVPGVISLAEAAGVAPASGMGPVKSTSVHGFRMVFKASGPETPFAIKVPEKPKALHLDPRTMVPTTAINATLEPRSSLLHKAAALRSTGRSEEAGAAYNAALALKLDVNPDDPPARGADVARRTEIENAWIHLELAELAIDRGRFDEAAAELGDPSVKVFTIGTGGAFQIKALKARVAVHAGDPAAAYKLLNGALALDVLQKETDTGPDAFRKEKLNSGRYGNARDYLVYAAAAHATGHEDICREAAAEAKRHGGDPSILEGLPPGAR
jgi:tetratricopeptide (TPR) repeat protein